MEELAAFLEVAPADVLDTASFYEEYWLKPKGKYLVQVCRSLSCEITGSNDLTQKMKDRIGIGWVKPATTGGSRWWSLNAWRMRQCSVDPDQ